MPGPKPTELRGAQRPLHHPSVNVCSGIDGRVHPAELPHGKGEPADILVAPADRVAAVDRPETAPMIRDPLADTDAAETEADERGGHGRDFQVRGGTSRANPVNAVRDGPQGAILTVRADGRHFAAMPEVETAVKRGWLIKLAVLAALVLTAAILLVRGVDLRALSVRAMALIGDAGPWVFFSAMAILPAVGFPLLAFVLPAGPAFSGQLGVAGVIAACAAAVGVNLALTYWLARYAVRPLAARLLARAGYKIPQFARDEQAEVTVLLRITPGPPFFVQNYLLGLGNVAFGTYLWISWCIVTAQGVGIIVFGEAAVHGRGGMAVFGVCLVIAAAIAIHLVRKHLGKGRRPAA